MRETKFRAAMERGKERAMMVGPRQGRGESTVNHCEEVRETITHGRDIYIYIYRSVVERQRGKEATY